MNHELCEFCKCDIPKSAQLCHHCGRPSLFPNVKEAESKEEKDALEKRYTTARSIAIAAGHRELLEDFEAQMGDTTAVIARSLLELSRLANSDDEIYTTYYNLLSAGLRKDSDIGWARRRHAADSALFLFYLEDVRFGSLSLSGEGIENYGECHLELKDSFIAHRASLLEENSVKFLQKHGINPLDEDIDIPKGYRAVWEDRAKLCVAKLAPNFDDATPRGDFSKVLLKQGTTSEDDEFIEVHILGPMTRQCFKSVKIVGQKNRADRLIVKAVAEKLAGIGVKVSMAP